MSKVKEFFQRKDIVISGRRYGVEALGAMAQGLFCSLLIGTIRGPPWPWQSAMRSTLRPW